MKVMIDFLNEICRKIDSGESVVLVVFSNKINESVTTELDLIDSLRLPIKENYKYLKLFDYVVQKLKMEFGRIQMKLRSGPSDFNKEKGRQRDKLEERVSECCDQNDDETVPHFLWKCPRFEGIRDAFLYLVEKDVEFVKKWTEGVEEKDNIEDEKEFIKDASENVEEGDLDDIIFNLL
eukprot:Awhi_evm1s3960